MQLKVFTGTSNPELAGKICKYLGIELGKCEVSKFSDGEIFVEIKESVRGQDIYVVQSTCPPANDNLMELLLILDALKRASASNITAVIPYYGYARQDRKVQPRTPISAKLVADLITTAGAHRVVTVDLHAGQIQGFFNIPVDNLYAMPVLLDYLKGLEEKSEDLVIVSPDAGGTERARAFAKRLGCSLALIDKRRPRPNVAEVMNVIGNVEGKTAVIVDDMVDTGGTLIRASNALKEKGATRVLACCTHPVLSGDAVSRIDNSEVEKLIVTDTIPLSDGARKSEKVHVLSVSELLGETIKRIHRGESVSSLFV